MSEEKKYSFGSIRAIIGLGNPGAKYYKTRHNIGFRVLDALASRYDASWSSRALLENTQISVLGDDGYRSIYLIKPQTFMNSSGQAFPFLLKKGIKAEAILVVHDELERGFGKLMIRLGGSHRGHNGLRSIEGVIGREFWRLRFGVSRPTDKSQVANYVLAPFSSEEESEIEHAIEEAIGLIFMGREDGV